LAVGYKHIQVPAVDIKSSRRLEGLGAVLAEKADEDAIDITG
jgi:hypothetical protein